MSTVAREKPIPGVKRTAVKNTEKLLKDATGFFGADLTGYTVADSMLLRRKLHESGTTVRTVKNRLTKIALKNLGMDELIEYMKGPVTLLVNYEDELAPIREFTIIRKKLKKGRVTFGWIGGGLYDEEAVTELAKLPSKEELYARVVAAAAYPLSGFINILASPLRGAITALSQIEKRRKED